MEVLPIKCLTPSDKIVYGTNLFNLSQLKRLGFSVPDGVLISPPEIVLKTVLKHVADKSKETFEQSLTLIKSEIIKTPPPQEFEKNIYTNQSFFLNGKIYSAKSCLWRKLMEIWLDEIRGKIWNLGFNLGITESLIPQAVFFISAEFETGEAFFDPEKNETVISFGEEKLIPQVLHEIDQIVISANKKLYIPQIFDFIKFKNNKIGIVNLKPFTQSLPLSKKESIVIPRLEQKKIVKSAVKIFLNLANGFAIDPNIDGLLIEGEHSSDFDELVFRLTEGALSYPSKPIFFKLPDIDDGELKSVSRLLHNKKSLDEPCNAFLFIRNKKTLLNVEIVIPKVNNLDDFLSLKRELASRNITRKGSMRIWLEMGIPENLINIENYLESGLDGVLLDLDSLQKLLTDGNINQPDLAKIHIQTIIKFLEPVLKKLHQNKIPFIAGGVLILHPDIINFLVEKGCWGIIANNIIEAENYPEHLSWIEKRMLQKRTM